MYWPLGNKRDTLCSTSNCRTKLSDTMTPSWLQLIYENFNILNFDFVTTLPLSFIESNHTLFILNPSTFFIVLFQNLPVEHVCIVMLKTIPDSSPLLLPENLPVKVPTIIPTTHRPCANYSRDVSRYISLPIPSPWNENSYSARTILPIPFFFDDLVFYCRHIRMITFPARMYNAALLFPYALSVSLHVPWHANTATLLLFSDLNCFASLSFFLS